MYLSYIGILLQVFSISLKNYFEIYCFRYVLNFTKLVSKVHIYMYWWHVDFVNILAYWFSV